VADRLLRAGTKSRSPLIYLNATVSAIDLGSPNTEQVVHRFAVGGAPQNVIVDPADHTVYVTNTVHGTISVLAS
jgi:DNA-binding beta-propeller fold protein YncE